MGNRWMDGWMDKTTFCCVPPHLHGLLHRADRGSSAPKGRGGRPSMPLALIQLPGHAAAMIKKNKNVHSPYLVSYYLVLYYYWT